MPIVPDWDLGDRKLDNVPQVPSPRSDWGVIGREIGATARAGADAIDRIAEVRRRERLRAAAEAERAAAVQDRADDREAQYRIAEGVNWFKNHWNGQDVQDAQTGEWTHVPGVADRNWQEMDAEKTSALDEMERLRREFRQTEIYTEMTPAQRQKFERGWKFKEDEFRRAAAAKHAGLRAEKIQFQNAALDKADDDEVLMVEGKDMQTYLATAEHAAARKVLRRYGSAATVGEEIDPNSSFFHVSDIVLKGADPETEEGRKKYDEMFRAYQAVVDEYHKNRITNLTRLAERDAPMADFMLAEARKTVWEMEGKGPDGRDVWISGGVDEKGNQLPAEMRAGTISDIEAQGLHELIAKAGRNRDEMRAAELRRAKHDANQEVLKRELEIRKYPQEQWASAYEQLGENADLQRLDPQKAMAYLDTARELRAAGEKAKVAAAKANVAATENALATSLSRLQVLQTEGLITQEEENEAQAAIWRKFRVSALNGGIGEEFMRSFHSRLQTGLSDQERNAMRKFYSAFGYEGELRKDAGLSLTQKERKEAEGLDFYAPPADGEEEGTRAKRISGKELFEYGEKFLRTLRTLGPDVNREGAVEAEINRLKTDWVKKDFKANLDASVRNILEIQREMRTRQISGGK